MISYYTSIMIICWLTLAAMGVLIYKNNRITRESKRLLYLTYVLVAVSALAEWCGVQLNGRTDLPRWMLGAAKCADYILTPMAGGALVVQMQLHNRWQKAMIAILGANAVLQAAAAPFGWMFVIDGQNRYTHGPLFPVYLGVCLVIYVMIILQFTIYGRSFRRQNRSSLYAVMLLVIVGIGMQELLPDIRTAYLGMTIGTALMFIHYTEFAQMSADSHIAEQQRELRTDPLTGLLNRYAYSHALKHYASHGSLPENFAAFAVDINGLKKVNDTLGHEAGDELILGAAECVSAVFGDGASCYRTGGDEFVVLVTDTGRAEADAALARLKEEAAAWLGSDKQSLSLATGCALAKDNPGLNAEELVRRADIAMYSSKAEYYRSSGHDRRRSR